MKHTVLTFVMLALCACTPKPAGPEATVTAIYETLAASKGASLTPPDAIPMTDDLRALVAQAEAAAGDAAPVFDFDLAGNCQDCTDFADLKVAPQENSQAVEGGAGHTILEASFRLFMGEPHAVLWDMVETPQGWRVDNILAEGFDLRAIASDIIAGSVSIMSVEDDAAFSCIAVLSLQASAAPAEAATLQAAADAWRAQAGWAYSPEERAQYVASSVAVADDLTAAEIAANAADCLARAPAQ